MSFASIGCLVWFGNLDLCNDTASIVVKWKKFGTTVMLVVAVNSQLIEGGHLSSTYLPPSGFI